MSAAMIVLSIAPIASAQRRSRDRDSGRHPGYVDGSAFAELADEDDNVIEISVSGALLKMLSGAIGQENEALGDVLGGIVSINAVVVELSGGNGEKAVRLARSTAKELAGDGWEQIVRVQEKGDTNVVVLAHNDGDDIDGLVVLVVEANDQVVFANVAGTIDLAGLAKLGANFDVGGLEQLSEEIMKQAVNQTGKSKSRRRSRD
jgi:hypothetical protein